MRDGGPVAKCAGHFRSRVGAIRKLLHELLHRVGLCDGDLALCQEGARVVCGVGETVGVGNRLRKLPLWRKEGGDGLALLPAYGLPVGCHASEWGVEKYWPKGRVRAVGVRKKEGKKDET